MNPQTPQATPPITFWMIWAAILFGLFILQYFIIGGFHLGEATASVPFSTLAICMAGFLISSIVRWTILPRQKSLAAMLPVMVVGIAIGESTGLLGIFMIGKSNPGIQLATFILSVLAIVQYMPVYAQSRD